jgi:FAD:protein FMN transferase
MEHAEFFAMNTEVLCMAEGQPGRVAAGFAAVQAWVAECEQRFSRFRPDSELCQLNRAAGQWFPASPGLYELVETALEMHTLTDGLFDPSILPALQQAGYDRSLDEIRRTGDQPAPSLHARPTDTATARFAQTRLDGERQAIRLPENVQIDLGGLAKGWIVERAARRLATYSLACAVDAGGDMSLVGIPTDFLESAPETWPSDAGRRSAGRQPPDFLREMGWRVALEDPRDPRQTLAVLRVGPGALVTSSLTRRRWTQRGQPRHHIIDPRTGQPAEPPWLSVTVFAPRAAVAEAFAKAILLAGWDGALTLAQRVPNLRFIAVNPDGGLWGTPESMEMIDVPQAIY